MTTSGQTAEHRLAGYPRLPLRTDIETRLPALRDAYYGLSVPYLTSLCLLVVSIVLSLTSGRKDYIDDLGFVELLPALASPLVAAWLSYKPLKSFAKGTGWRPTAAFGLAGAIPIYMTLLYAAVPSFADQPAAYSVVEFIVGLFLAFSVFPLLRVWIGWNMRKLGFRPGILLLGRRRVDAEVQRVIDKTAQRPTNPT